MWADGPEPYSPHAWGWTARSLPRANPVPVFPTRVGMDQVQANMPIIKRS